MSLKLESAFGAEGGRAHRGGTPRTLSTAALYADGLSQGHEVIPFYDPGGEPREETRRTQLRR